jgi:hypothetical protein
MDIKANVQVRVLPDLHQRSGRTRRLMNGLTTPEPGRGAGGASQLFDIPIDPRRDATSSKCPGQASKSLLELDASITYIARGSTSLAALSPVPHHSDLPFHIIPKAHQHHLRHAFPGHHLARTHGLGHGAKERSPWDEEYVGQRGHAERRAIPKR